MGGAWWVGECVGLNEDVCNIRFEFMPSKYSRRPCDRVSIRKHQVWTVDGVVSRWFYETNLNPVYAVGHYIEVQKTIRECPNAYHVASILRMLEETVEVEYHNITTANGERYVEYVEYDIIRPTPYIFPTDFGFNDAIDVWMTDSWWPGLYVGTEANDYIVYLPYMPETNQNFLVPQEFTRRNCCRGCTNDISCWTYTKNN